MLCPNCKKELENGEVICSGCNKMLSVEKGGRAAYHIFTYVSLFLLSQVSIAIGLMVLLPFATHFNVLHEISGAITAVFIALLLISFICNLSICKAMRCEEWEKRHDKIIWIPTVLYIAALIAALVLIFVLTEGYIVHASAVLCMLIVQLFMARKACKIRDKTLEMQAMYAENEKKKKSNSREKEFKGINMSVRP